VSSDTGSGDEDAPPPEQQQHQIQPSNPEQRRCKRCGAVLGPETTTRFGDQPVYDVYVCAACGFIEWVAVS
jgi:DNA-directed RNA polymerase subunit M/transcription elongation factor TFIIS